MKKIRSDATKACIIASVNIIIAVLIFAIFGSLKFENTVFALLTFLAIIWILGYPVAKMFVSNWNYKENNRRWVYKKIKSNKLIQVQPLENKNDYYLFFMYVLPKFAKFYAIKIREEHVTIVVKFDSDKAGIYYFLRHEQDWKFSEKYEIVKNGEINPLVVEKMDKGLRGYWE